MSSSVDSFGALRAFVAAADSRSFRLAGQELGLSSSAVGKAVAKLEDQLSATLLHRTTRTISLTEAGKIFVSRARRILAELEAGEAALAEASGSPRGYLRVSLPVSDSLLTRSIGAFVERYPLVKLELDYTDRIVDLIDEGFDVVIRTGAAADSRLLHKSLGKFRWALVASVDYLDRRGLPAATPELENHACLRQRLPSGRIAPWPIKSLLGQDAPVSLCANNIDPLLDLVLSGSGIGCFPEFLVRDHIVKGRLVSLLENEIELTTDLLMLWPASKFKVPKVRAFVDLMVKGIRDELSRTTDD